MTESVTSMYNCTHGPKKDCADCLVRELVAELGAMVDWLENWEAKPKNLLYTAIVAPKIAAARAVLEKAKLLYVGPAEMPLDHGHPHE